MANIPISAVTAAGAIFTTAGLGQAAASGDTVQGVDNDTFLVVYNGSGGSINVTVADPGRTPAGNAGTPVAVAVAATSFGLIPLYPSQVDPSTGLVSLTYSATASVRVAGYRR